jgi:hypothetical protein
MNIDDRRPLHEGTSLHGYIDIVRGVTELAGDGEELNLSSTARRLFGLRAVHNQQTLRSFVDARLGRVDRSIRRR